MVAKSQTSTNTNNGLAEKDVFDVLFNQDLFPKNNNNGEVGNEFSYDTYNTDQSDDINNKDSQDQNVNLYGNNVNNVAFEQTIGQEFNVGNGHKSNDQQQSNENLHTDTNVKTSGNEMNTKPPTIRKRPLTNKHNLKSVSHFFLPNEPQIRLKYV